MKSSCYMNATWDAEASVWLSQTDIPGLVIEAETLAEFEALFEELAPQMLAANEDVHNQSVAVDFTAKSRRELFIA
jgi:hypothetical protein